MRRLPLLLLFCAAGAACGPRGAAAQVPNPPWAPSLMAFEHYDSGRTHLFAQAAFGGDVNGTNATNAVASRPFQPGMPTPPTPYNVVYADNSSIIVYGGSYGDAGGTGAFLARVDAATLATVWVRPLINATAAGIWNYPGVVSLLESGVLNVIYGVQVANLNYTDGAILAGPATLPSLQLPQYSAYNGNNGFPGGPLVAKTISIEAGCTAQGFTALLQCPDTQNPSLIVAYDRDSLNLLARYNASQMIGGRLTATVLGGRKLMYVAESTRLTRLEYVDGPEPTIREDRSWGPVRYVEPGSGQQLASAPVVGGDWVFAQTNALPAVANGTDPYLTVIAVNQNNASLVLKSQPFRDLPTGSRGFFSFAPSSVSADPEDSAVFALDYGPGYWAKLRVAGTPPQLQVVWRVSQPSLEFITVFGPSVAQRVLAGTEYNANATLNRIVYRRSSDGVAIAQSDYLPRVSSGTLVSPGYGGKTYVLGSTGLYELQTSGRAVTTTTRPSGAVGRGSGWALAGAVLAAAMAMAGA
ncbi:hypothetical protein DFJ74DRAFT_745586 [Hyaloraphidium curvatum]|nr:hypothetical protein DFJ74DRAFT_745586 [Hyaloraphidium curvatum]